MEIDKIDELHDLTRKMQAINNMQSEYFSLTAFISEIKTQLDGVYNLNNKKYESETAVRLIKNIHWKVDEYIQEAEKIRCDNYYLNEVLNDLTKRINNLPVKS